jgi:hypothetical protein
MYLFIMFYYEHARDRRGHGRMVVGFLTTCAISIRVSVSVSMFETRTWRGVLMQRYVIKFVSDLRQVDGFLRVLRVHPPIKLTTTI